MNAESRFDLVRVRLNRSVSEGMPAGVSAAVTDEDLTGLEPALVAAAAELQGRRDAGEVGFADVDRSGWAVQEAAAVAAVLRAESNRLLVVGIGGSALGARALDAALGPDSGRAPATSGQHRVVVLDTVDPARVRATLATLDPARTSVAVVSKSGGTLETTAVWRVVQPWLSAATERWRQRVVVITDAATGPLRALAKDEDLPSLPVPGNVGGRFSVLTAVGLLPAAYLGLDIDALLTGASRAAAACERPDFATNPAWRFAAAHQAWWKAGARVSVFIPYCARLRVLGDWYVQLFAESLGKLRTDGQSVGWTPTAAEGPVDQHSQLQLWQQGPRDKLVTIVAVDDPGVDLEVGTLEGSADAAGAWLAGRNLADILEAEREGTLAALVEAGRPVIQMHLPRLDEESVGALIMTLQFATALSGPLLGVDPFDQPGVEAGKRFACGLLGRPGYESFGVDADRILNG